MYGTRQSRRSKEEKKDNVMGSSLQLEWRASIDKVMGLKQICRYDSRGGSMCSAWI